tara:strand:+ start:307 stop:1098 length:792 start_codon:yes stop_codon:yes gene_type:complete
MDGNKYVIFHAGSDNSYMNTTANFRGADVGATFIDLFFASSAGIAGVGNSGGTGYDKVRLTVTATHEENALEGVAGAMVGSGPKGRVTVIADDNNSIYAHERITAVASITLASQPNFRPVEAITNASAVTRTLTTAESGMLFTVDMSTVDNNVALTLPTATTAGVAGTYYDFVFLVDCDDDADFSLSTAVDAIDFYGYIVRGAANNTVQDIDGDASKLTIDANVGQDIEGLRFSVLCDGANWHLAGYNTTAIGTANITLSTSA